MIPDNAFNWALKQDKFAKIHDKIKKSLKLSQKIRKNRKKVAASPNNVCERFCYHMSNQTSGLPGMLMRSEHDKESMDREIDEAFNWAGIVRQFFKEVLGIDSYDNKATDLISSCHYDKNYDNAFFNGEQMVYGDGSLFYPLTRSLDVSAHEMGHGITYSRSNLNYSFQSGALNEHLSDVVGITCKQWYFKQTNPETANWLIGDDICKPEFGKALRSFKDEKAYPGDTQPKHKKDVKWWDFSDNGRVHGDSGIPNHVFYLFCIKTRTSSYEMPLQIWDAASKKLKSTSNFRAFKKITLQCALDIGGEGVKQDLTDAWKEVGY